LRRRLLGAWLFLWSWLRRARLLLLGPGLRGVLLRLCPLRLRSMLLRLFLLRLPAAFSLFPGARHAAEHQNNHGQTAYSNDSHVEPTPVTYPQRHVYGHAEGPPRLVE